MFTTIFDPESILQALYENISRYHHLEEVKVWVVGDKKTPAIVAGLAGKFSALGMETVYFSVEEQDLWGKNMEFYGRVPYNNHTRRNFGILKALADGCQILISIDDDNFPTADDFIGFHSNNGKPYDGMLITETAGFHNLCEYLEFAPKRSIYPRGFPLALRDYANKPQLRSAGGQNFRIGVIEGLWLQDPDIDATTWLNGTVKGKAYTGQDMQVLDRGTWTPINSQNTSIARELLPAFLMLPMAWPVPGGKIDRYDDIWGGYFLQAVMEGSPYRVAFGRPIVEHRRNPHNYADDLRYEFWGIILTDWLVQRLHDQFRSSNSGIAERMLDLAEFIKQSAEGLPAWRPQEMKEFMLQTAVSMRLWVETCRKIGV